MTASIGQPSITYEMSGRCAACQRFGHFNCNGRVTPNQARAVQGPCPSCGAIAGSPCGKWRSNGDWIICRARYAAVGLTGR